MKYLQTETTEPGPFLGKTGACQTAQNGLMLKLQSHRHPRVLSIRVGKNFLCLISINSPTRFARSGITLKNNNEQGFAMRVTKELRQLKAAAKAFACVFDDYLLKSYVYF